MRCSISTVALLMSLTSSSALRTTAGTHSRRAVVISGALASGAAGPQCACASASTLALLGEARAQLEACDQLISDGVWDGVRNIVKTAPLANVKNLATTYMKELDTDEAGDLVVPREDVVQALQLLDMAVYNNVFVGEQNGQGKRGAGVQIDRATPRRHVGEAKEALDQIIAFK